MTTSLSTTLDTLLAAAQLLPSADRLALASLLRCEAALPRSVRPRRCRPDAEAPEPASTRFRSRLSQPTRTAADRHALYGSSVWRSRYRPGEELHVYILGCPGLARLAGMVGAPLFKVGTAKVGRLDERVGELGRERYGSLVRAADGTSYLAEAGFDDWTPPPKLQLSMPHPLGPVRAGESTFIVRLPAGLSHSEFESDLNRALRSAGLRGFADSDDGRAVLHQRGLDPDLFLRATLDRSKGLPVAAVELMLIRPQADGPALAALIEDIVINHVLGVRLRRAA